MPVGIFGDIHGDFATVRRIMSQHPEVRSWLAIGDLADDEGRYEAVESPIYWIKGNNENFDAIASGNLPASLHFLPNGTLVEVEGLRVACLGGTFAPTWYETPSAALPHPVKRTVRATALADKRRHFVREEVNRCKAFEDVDVLLTHEAPRPYRVKGNDAGKTAINEVLLAVHPRFHFFGHHHEFTDRMLAGVRSIGLDLVSRSYGLLNEQTLEFQLVKG